MIMNVNVDELMADILESKTVSDKKVNKYSLPGRGRKQCPDCQSYIGVRTQNCECGHEFVFNENGENPVVSKYDDPPLSDEDNRYVLAIGCGKGGRVVHVGAGAPPAELKMCDEQSVRNFCEDIVAAGYKDGKIYMPRAIKNFMRHVIGDRAITNNFTDVYIDKWYDDKVASTMGMEV
jgi:hypothetical protein